MCRMAIKNEFTQLHHQMKLADQTPHPLLYVYQIYKCIEKNVDCQMCVGALAVLLHNHNIHQIGASYHHYTREMKLTL